MSQNPIRTLKARITLFDYTRSAHASGKGQHTSQRSRTHPHLPVVNSAEADKFASILAKPSLCRNPVGTTNIATSIIRKKCAENPPLCISIYRGRKRIGSRCHHSDELIEEKICRATIQLFIGCARRSWRSVGCFADAHPLSWQRAVTGMLKAVIHVALTKEYLQCRSSSRWLLAHVPISLKVRGSFNTRRRTTYRCVVHAGLHLSNLLLRCPRYLHLSNFVPVPCSAVKRVSTRELINCVMSRSKGLSADALMLYYSECGTAGVVLECCVEVGVSQRYGHKEKVFLSRHTGTC
jgi:hypothetical protein